MQDKTLSTTKVRSSNFRPFVVKHWLERRGVLLTQALLATVVAAGCGGPNDCSEYLSISIAPSGKSVVFADCSGDLWQLDTNSKAVTPLLVADLISIDPRHSSDGKSIAFSQQTNGDAFGISVLSLTDGRVTRITGDPNTQDRFPVFSRDGRKVIFTRSTSKRSASLGGHVWDNWSVWSYDLNRGEANKLTESSFYSVNGIAESQDGSDYFVSADVLSSPKRELYKVTPGEFQATVVHIGDGAAAGNILVSGVASSGDGQRITFVSDRARPYHYDVFIYQWESELLRPLKVTREFRYTQGPAFKEDTQEVYFLAAPQLDESNRPLFSLWAVEVNGGNLRQIAGHNLFSEPEKIGTLP